MLTSLVVMVQAEKETTLPGNLGRAAQALLLGWVAERDPALAEAMHAGDGPRPYTASNLVLKRRPPGQVRLAPGEGGWLRFTGLTAEVSEVLASLAAAPPEAVMMDGQPLRVVGATLDPAVHPRAGATSYQTLATGILLGAERPPADKLSFEFLSPTTFRSGGRCLPLPLPELVFGSLLDRWHAFAPVGLSPETRRFAQEMTAISRYELRTQPLQAKEQGVMIGFAGRVTYKILSHDRYWLSVMNLLSAFSIYSGVGYQTAAGLGQVRPTRG